ncbi:MAG TPA: branched-chain amino acid ABC transporter permease [Xanthobacteraceae bacterium]|nr:branched-chain amino acid ABC transporter permease [Xanthobacteraceae bacterium]
MRAWPFLVAATIVAVVVFYCARALDNDYVFFAGYVVLQFIVLATAWNILGGYTGYVNFGSAAFFALGAYSSVFFHKAYPLPIPALMVIGGLVSGIVGLGTGYLTLRLRGAFFAIATLALAVVLQTLIINWTYVGGARGAYVIRPNEIAILGSYIQYLFLLMLVLAVIVICTARLIERSRLGYGFATIRDDELAAESCGVPTLRLKLIATTLSGAFMGMAGAPFPYYIGYIEPSSAFGLAYAVNSIAMPMIGGTTTWIGPLIGAILLGLLQQFATVTISSAVNLLIVGMLLVDFVIIAPNGIVGLIKERRTASNVVVEPTVFVLLFALNFSPVYFLAGQGTGAQSIGLVFWLILAYVAYMRGRVLGRWWLIAFPLAGVLFAFAPAIAAIPVTAATFVAALLQIICVVCGLLPVRRPAEASAR